MTVGIVVACIDGVVIGADRKVTKSRGTRIKSLEDKVYPTTFRDGRDILFCHSGGSDFARRALDEIDPVDIPETMDCNDYRDAVENRICKLQNRISYRGLEYDATILFATIDTDDKPTIGHITPTGVTEMRQKGYFTTGIAAPYAELVLQDSYSDDISIQDAKLIVGGLIQKIGKVDNDVEGMDVFIIPINTRRAAEIAWAERQAIETEPLSFNFKDELDELRREVLYWQKFQKRAERKLASKSKKSKEKQKGASQEVKKTKK